ncbi:MAG TPA: TonB-dependent receptor [Vicinamibacterales bacterium]|nr:TonB-dependent receptor [Vicinamibacterales bacterium]
MTRVMSWIAVALLLAVPAVAQQGTTELRGRVVDSQGGVLPGVTVTVRNQATGMYRETVSGADGTFIASALIPGTYEVIAELQGFKRFNRRDLRLEVGRTATIDVVLEVGALAETVNVTAESPLVDVTSKEIGGNIDSRELVELPTINGNFVGFVGLLPGIVPTISTESFGGDSVTVNGQDPRNNNYMLDGGNNNDDVIGQRAGTQARTPIESIQEFQVITNQFDAEYGRTAGAVINAVTKQGTNQFRGSAFLNAQDASLTAPDFFSERNDLPKPDTSYRRWGGTIGGPIVKDKMHFFFSLERFNIDEGITVNIPARPDLDATTTEQTRVWNTVIRGDHQINANNTYGIRWLRESSPQKNQVIGSVTLDAAREESDVDQTVVSTLNSVLSNTRVNTLRMAWTRENVAFANPCFNGNGRDQAACEPSLAFQTFSTQQSSVAQSRINDGIQVQDTLSWFLPGRHGDHDVKFGVTYEYIGARSEAQDNLNGTFSFGRSNGPFNAADPRTYPDRLSIRVGGPNRSFEKTSYLAGFAQDKWRFNNRLTVSLGLRYDLEVIPVPEEDNPLVEPGEYPVDKNNFAPRIGFSYDLNGNGDSVVRGGYGRFFDKTHFELIGGFFTDTVFTNSFTMNFPLDNFDPGPRNGQFPTDPLLVNGPVLNRDLVDSLFTPGTRLRNTGPTWDSADRVNPYTDQFSIGYQREVFANSSISADYVHARSRDLLMFLQLNPTLRATSNVDDPNIRQSSATLDAATAALRQKYPGLTPFTGAVNTPVNTGETNYDALMVQFDKRFSQGYSAKVSYTLAHSRGNTSGSGAPTSGFQVLDDMHLELNEGPTNFDRRHNLVISGTALVPHTGGLNFSWVARALSGTPFSLVNGDIDPDRNGSISEPLPAGDYSGTGEDAYSVNGAKNERNGAYGPGFFQLDMRFGYRFALGANRHLNAFVDLFNLTNRTNFGNPSGNLASPNFLILTDYDTSYTPRKLQIGARFEF